MTLVTTYRFTELDLPGGGGRGAAAGVNSTGSVVGDVAGSFNGGVLWRSGSVIQLPPTEPDEGGGTWGGFVTAAINDAEEVVGGLRDHEGGWIEAAGIWRNGQLTDLKAVTGDVYSNAKDINQSGVIAASGGPSDGAFTYDIRAGGDFHYHSAGDTNLYIPRALNAAAQVVGGSNVRTPADAYFYDGDRIVDLWWDQLAVSWLNDINDSGLGVGAGGYGRSDPLWPLLSDMSGTDPMFVWLDPLETGISKGGEAHAVNHSGEIVGNCNGRAFHYDAGVMTDLNDVVDSGEVVLASATDISDSGRVVGHGVREHIRPDGQTERVAIPYLLTPREVDVRVPFETLITIVFGVTEGGGGLGVLPNGEPVPVDPSGWRALDPAQRRALAQRAVGEVAAKVGHENVSAELSRLAGPGG